MGKVQRGSNAKGIDYQRTREQFFRDKLKFKQDNVDTQIRMELQAEIVASVIKGENREDIINELASNEKYKKFAPYFGSYVDNVLGKYEKTKQKMEDKEEKER